MRRLLFFLFTLSILPLRIAAQQMNFSPLESPLNLPSEECYNILQDSKGYIWICTENGLCKYNGNSVKIFNKENGLPEGAVYFISEDKHGVIHLITSANRIMKIENDSLTEEKFSAPFLDFLAKDKAKLSTAYTLFVDDHEDYIINTEKNTYRIDHRNFAITNLTENLPHKTGANSIIVSQRNGNYLIRNLEIFSANSDKGPFNITVDFVSAKGTKKIIIPFNRYEYPDWRIRMCRLKNGTTFFCVHNKLIRVDEQLNYTVYDMPGVVLSLFCDSENGLWVGLFQNGLRYYSDVNKMENTGTALNSYSVSGIITDKEGTAWCTTLENGVFYCNNRYAVDYSNIAGLKKVCSLLKCVGDNVFIATENDQFIILNKGTIKYRDFGFRKNVALTDVLRYNNTWYFSSKSYVTATDDDFHPKKFIKQQLTKTNICVYQLDTGGGKLYGVAPSGIILIDPEKGGLHQSKSLFIRTRVLLYKDDNTILVGCNDGLYTYNITKRALTRIKATDGPVTKIIKAADGKVWIATKAGLYVLKNNTTDKITFAKDIRSDIFLDIVEDRYKNIWVASSAELLKINDAEGRLNVVQYNVSNGLLSDNIKHIAVNDQSLYVSTTKGVCSIPIDKDLGNKVAPPVFISSVIAGGRGIDHKRDAMIFPYTENSFEIHFDALTYKKGGDGMLLYQLIGQDDSMKVSRQSDLHFENLSPGEYKLVVYALSNDGVKSAEPVTLNFVVEKPFWQQLWFIAICIIVFFTLLFFSVKKIIQNVKYREGEKTRINKLIAESQLSALQAQMNPHFIFNAINSIQNYILKKEEKEAYDYLAKFSKLIRIVLNNSRENTLQLYQELETLKLYVELEKLRFKDSFEFRVTLSEDVDEHEIYLPAMLIQPYIENAIWHGLMNLDEGSERMLELDISIQSNLLLIVVKDNGIGRKRSYEYKKESLHHPVGMKLTEQRLQMINKIKDYEGIRVAIIDLFDKDGNACGTKIELFLPLTI